MVLSPCFNEMVYWIAPPIWEKRLAISTLSLADGLLYLCRELVCITVKWTWYNGRDIFFFISRPGGLTREKV